MERLTALLRRKVRNEDLEKKEPEESPREGKKMKKSATASSSQNALSCWLCGHKTSLRFRLKDTSALCFPCFHTAYVALILPIIDTPKRRLSDYQLACKIEKLQIASDAELNAETTDPSEDALIGFSHFPTHRQRRARGPDKDKKLELSREILTESMSPSFGLGIVTSCPDCGADLSNLSKMPPSGNVERSLCCNEEIHIVWQCQDCGAVSTVEGDCCRTCQRPRLWSCRYCTALQTTARSAEGLRYCLMCGNYNTPEDLFLGQATIDEENEMARRTVGNDLTDSDVGITGSVVFGVNDSCTLLELERQQEIEANTYRLKCRLEKLELKCCAQKDDGNCLFASLAHQLFGKAHLHYIVRSCVVSYMKENETDYMVFFNGVKEWQQYLSNMKKCGFWGDEICINAAARCFCVNIHVITSDPTRWHLIFQHDQLGSSKSKLCHKTPVHSTTKEVAGKGKSSSLPSSLSLRKASSISDTVISLFLVYKSPVHFDDIEPSEPSFITLSDILVPELYNLRQLEAAKIVPKVPQTRGVQKAGTGSMSNGARQVPCKHLKSQGTRMKTSSSTSSSMVSSEVSLSSYNKGAPSRYPTSGVSTAATFGDAMDQRV